MEVIETKDFSEVWSSLSEEAKITAAVLTSSVEPDSVEFLEMVFEGSGMDVEKIVSELTDRKVLLNTNLLDVANQKVAEFESDPDKVSAINTKDSQHKKGIVPSYTKNELEYKRYLKKLEKYEENPQDYPYLVEQRYYLEDGFKEFVLKLKKNQYHE